MAALKAVARKNGVTTTTSTLTVVQIKAPANQRVKVPEIGIGFHGVVNTDAPITVDLIRQSTAGTMSSLTPVPLDEDIPETIQTTAQHTATAEPTAAAILATWSVHPQTGMVLQFAKGDEPIVKGGGYLGLRVTAGVSVTCDAYMKFEE